MKKNGRKMKKIFTIIFLIFISCVPIFSQSSVESDSTDAWNDLKKTGKDVLQKTENFLKAAGAEIKEGVDNIKKVKCLGAWVYKGKNCTTTITVNEDGTMEVEQREGFLNSVCYKGNYTQVIRSLNFQITEKISSSWLSKKEDDDIINETWFISYANQDDENKMKFTISNIPEDSDKTDFSQGVIFTKK